MRQSRNTYLGQWSLGLTGYPMEGSGACPPLLGTSFVANFSLPTLSGQLATHFLLPAFLRQGAVRAEGAAPSQWSAGWPEKGVFSMVLRVWLMIGTSRK